MRWCVTEKIGNYGSLFHCHTETHMNPINLISFLCWWNFYMISTLPKKEEMPWKSNKICPFFSSRHILLSSKWHSHTLTLCQSLWCIVHFSLFLCRFSELVKSAFTRMQQSRGKINTLTFVCHLPGYLTAAWPWKALSSSEDKAAVLSYSPPPLNVCQKLKDKRGKR